MMTQRTNNIGGHDYLTFQFSLSKNKASSPLPVFFLIFYLFIHDRHRKRGREAETQAEGEAGSMPGLDPGASGSCPGPKGGVKPLSHPGIPKAGLS